MSNKQGVLGNAKDVEIRILLQLLKGLSGNFFSFAGVNTDRLIALADMHKVNYPLLLFSRQHSGIFTREQVETLGNRCRLNAQRSLIQLHELTRIVKGLNEAGIGHVCVKGPQLARMIYGREALKESVDLDIMLANARDLQTVHGILTGMGYTRSNLDDYRAGWKRRIFLIAQREVHYFNRGVQCAIDLHIRPGANTYLTASRFRGIMSRVDQVDLEGTVIPVLPDEVYLVYLCYHGSLHQFSRLAWLMDIRAFLSFKQPVLDFVRLINLAKVLQVDSSVFLAMHLLQHYFGDEMPRVIAEQLPYSARYRYLIRVCTNIISRDPGYWMTFRGRTEKVIYIMLLMKGIAARIDWLFGIFMRFVVKRIF
jgi:hypothetical protein